MTTEQTFKNITRKLHMAGLIFTADLSQDSITIQAEDDEQAKQILGMDRFRDYINEVEVVIV